MIATYYKLVRLSDEVRASNKIKSKARLDCVAFTDLINYKGIEPFKNSKGQFFLYKLEAKNIVKTDSKRICEWILSNGSLNFSSIYFEDFDFPQYAYGYPNSNRLLKNGSPNLLFPFRNDGYLFVVNKDFTEVEILIIPDARNLIGSYYHTLIDGGFTDNIKQFRGQAKQFHNYSGLTDTLLL